MKNFLIALILIPFFLLSLILSYFYVEALRLKIQYPHTKNLETESFVWIGLILTAFIAIDILILRLFIKKLKVWLETE
jgi:hypothetical protein